MGFQVHVQTAPMMQSIEKSTSEAADRLHHLLRTCHRLGDHCHTLSGGLAFPPPVTMLVRARTAVELELMLFSSLPLATWSRTGCHICWVPCGAYSAVGSVCALAQQWEQQPNHLTVTALQDVGKHCPVQVTT